MKNSLIATALSLLLCATAWAGTFPGTQSTWNGCARYDFKFQDRDAIMVVPEKPLAGNPWILRPAFFDAFPSVDKALLAEGFHVAYYDLTHLYGSPRAISLGNAFYEAMVRDHSLSSKVTLEGFSRGGLCSLNWASTYPETVACLYIDAPVCDIFQWPGRKDEQLWKDFLAEWNLTDQDMEDFQGNPLERLAPIAQAGIPIFAVCGDSDKTVPYELHFDKVRSRFLELGGSVELILKPGCDHHPHSLDNPEPVVDFILRNQPCYEAFQHYTLRGTLHNAFLKFEKVRKGRVAFVGGSITEMRGWHNQVMDQLRQRFPFTEFDFVEAGISSTGSTPGAFRLQKDVLSRGPIDLLFVEAAVNDHTNYFTPEEQVRGMEGEVRQALLSNPQMDIVMLHFIYDPFIEIYKAGRVPDVILNHERVANHYKISSINLAQEVFERMEHGQLTWEAFGGTHPSWFGHKFYTAAIAQVFEKMALSSAGQADMIPHEIPAEPLDAYSYFRGNFLDIQEAELQNGWTLVKDWKPADKAGTRTGFVQVPMLEAKEAGSQLTLSFEGTAIGFFCVCGPSAGVVEYSIDGAPFQNRDTFTQWSSDLYIPWVYVLESELSTGPHTLVLKMSSDKNPRSQGHALQIRNFVVNP